MEAPPRLPLRGVALITGLYSPVSSGVLERLNRREFGGTQSAACGSPPCRAYRPQRSCGRVAEGGGLLNRYRVVKPYRGFESLRLRHPCDFCFSSNKLASQRTINAGRCVMMTRLAISGYRSLRDIRVPLGALNVVTGANGSGKSSLYRALKLLADIAQGRVIQSLATEGGLQSTLLGRSRSIFPRHESRHPAGPGPGPQKSS